MAEIKTVLPELPEPDSYCTHADCHEYDVYNADQMRAYAEAAVLSASNAGKVDEWIDVKDMLPDLHSFVLVSIDDRYCDTDFDVSIASYTMNRNGKNKVFTMSGGKDYHAKAITHWQPIPVSASRSKSTKQQAIDEGGKP